MQFFLHVNLLQISYTDDYYLRFDVLIKYESFFRNMNATQGQLALTL